MESLGDSLTLPTPLAPSASGQQTPQRPEN
ncbi:hypothetical protein FHT32_004723 [Variovorax sp. SG517]|nr:hypothetical protein [Variovorax sp. SG517]